MKLKMIRTSKVVDRMIRKDLVEYEVIFSLIADDKDKEDIEFFKFSNYLLAAFSDPESNKEAEVCVKDLLGGVTLKSFDVELMMDFEEEMEFACRQFYGLLNRVRMFSGEHEIDLAKVAD